MEKIKVSSCCGAGVDEDRLICFDCKEHCGVEELKGEELNKKLLDSKVCPDCEKMNCVC